MHQQVCLKEFTQWNHYQVRITVLFGVKVERGVLRWKYTLKIHVMHRSVFFEKRIEGSLAGLLVRGARQLASLAAAPLELSSHPFDWVWTAGFVVQFETCKIWHVYFTKILITFLRSLEALYHTKFEQYHAKPHLSTSILVYLMSANSFCGLQTEVAVLGGGAPFYRKIQDLETRSGKVGQKR